MSDIDPELPDYLIDAILSQGPPPDAIDLVKNAFSWRTIDAELMELSYDSVLDDAGVRDASARRTLEFTMGEVSVVLEIDGLAIEGVVSPPADGTVYQSIDSESNQVAVVGAGRFDLVLDAAGPVTLLLQLGSTRMQLPAFTAG